MSDFLSRPSRLTAPPGGSSGRSAGAGSSAPDWDPTPCVRPADSTRPPEQRQQAAALINWSTDARLDRRQDPRRRTVVDLGLGQRFARFVAARRSSATSATTPEGGLSSTAPGTRRPATPTARVSTALRQPGTTALRRPGTPAPRRPGIGAATAGTRHCDARGLRRTDRPGLRHEARVLQHCDNRGLRSTATAGLQDDHHRPGGTDGQMVAVGNRVVSDSFSTARDRSRHAVPGTTALRLGGPRVDECPRNEDDHHRVGLQLVVTAAIGRFCSLDGSDPQPYRVVDGALVELGGEPLKYPTVKQLISNDLGFKLSPADTAALADGPYRYRHLETEADGPTSSTPAQRLPGDNRAAGSCVAPHLAGRVQWARPPPSAMGPIVGHDSHAVANHLRGRRVAGSVPSARDRTRPVDPTPLLRCHVCRDRSVAMVEGP